MHLLAVAPYVPYEGVPHAGGEYLLRHLEQLAAHDRVTLLTPGTPAALEHVRGAPDWLEVVVPELHLDRRSRSRWLADAAYRRAMSAPPGPTAESLRAVRAGALVARAREADVVELHWPEYARFATELRRAGVRTPVSVVEHDVDLQANVRRIRDHARGYRRVLGLLTAPVPRYREKQGLSDADLVLVFKAADEQLLRRLGVSSPVHVLDPYLVHPAGPAPQRRPRTASFVAALWRRENADGAAWLLREVWPTVRSRVPDATLVLAGADPPGELVALARAAGGVEVTGRVPDLLPHYQQAQVFVSPLFLGGGLKFKVAQAMACALPVVGTRNALQGIVEHCPKDALWEVTDDPRATADALVRAFKDPKAAAETGRRAQQWARQRWSFERSLEAVRDRYEALAADARRGHGR